MDMGTPRERSQLEGIWLPLITPFTEGALDERALASLVRHYLAEPIDGFILAATTGEALTLDDAEVERLVAVAAETAAGQRPIFLGLCGSDTRKLVQRLEATAAGPVDGYLVTCPYYSRPSQEGLRRHFEALAASTTKPIALYNIPYRTGVNLANETVFRLAELEAIVGIKDCCAIPSQSFDLLRGRPPGFSVLTGEDAWFYSALAHGADGGILASAHVDPAAFAAVRAALLGGDRERALRLWSDLVDVVALLFAEPSPAPIKHWLWRRHLIPSPEVRLPMAPVSAALAGQIDRTIQKRARQPSA
ncbi:MAG TPA: 4-hydroxy-tetrahydrodipicolinate synthase, partial [Stellaceae bacterium]|nr:4-hydroxy-tetrahydrodipicolinate synthase [Stellaceae bacterium]